VIGGIYQTGEYLFALFARHAQHSGIAGLANGNNDSQTFVRFSAGLDCKMVGLLDNSPYHLPFHDGNVTTLKTLFEFLKQRLGLSLLGEDQIRTLDVGTPYDYASQCRVVVPMFLPEHGAGSEFDPAFGALLAQLFEATRGRALVLFTSYDSLRKSRDHVLAAAGSHASQVLAQGDAGSREAITEAFREDVHSVLLGTHSFWEGVDLAGETLSCLVMARLPFGVFTDPLIAARCERIEAEGGSAFSQYSLPSAVIRFRQGFGRLIRHREDRGVVIVADRRIVSKGYGKWFRASIPASISRAFDPEQLLEQVRDFLDGEA
jgi:ATP-dependent DNA helicase DinG